MELIDGVFYQLSKDNTLVAITADYPGLIPASQVTETGVSFFHQLSKDNTLVAIMADYPGLIPASQVTESGVSSP